MHPDSDLFDEIQRFEEQYAENPDSLVFARLADLHRKAGDPVRALAVLRRGLERHPEYLSAHIVRGRAHRDLGRDEEAREAFARVLELDAQNLVALRSLAEIARERGDEREAVRRYEQILELDPGNGEVRETLEDLSAGEPEGSGAGGGEPLGTEPLALGASDPVGLAEAATAFEQFDELDELGLEAPREVGGDADGEHEEIALEEPEGSVEPAVPPSSPPAGVESGASSIVPPAGARRLPEPPPEERPPAADGAAREGVAPAAEPGARPDSEGESVYRFPEGVDEEGADEPREADVEEEAGDEVTIAELEELLRGGPQSVPSAEEDEDLMTETLAGLYASQGFYEEAVEMYEELVRERPEDEELRERLAAVRRELLGTSGESGSEPSPETETPGEEAPEGPGEEPGATRGTEKPGALAEAGRADRAETELHGSAEDRDPAPLTREEALGAVEPRSVTMEQHLRELLRGEAVPGLVNDQLRGSDGEGSPGRSGP